MNLFIKILLNTIILFVLYSCSGEIKQTSMDKIIYKPRDIVAIEKTKNSDRNIIKDFLNIGDDKNSSDISNDLNNKYNQYLWKASIDILSALIPLSILDEKNGLVTTEWYTSKTKKLNRYKITVSINSTLLNKESINVKIYKQYYKSNNWLDSKVNADKNFKIKNKIIAKALSYKRKKEL